MTVCSIPRLMACFFIMALCTIQAVTGATQENYTRTPGDYEGPFYPVIRQQDEDNDLIHVKGRSQAAQGDILHLTGRVINTAGEPIPNAVVEIWQTDPKGLYKDRRDTSPGERDPDFQYWGKADTKADGTFSFITLVPGRYEPRPAHIHYKVWINDAPTLTSQIYFTNHPQEKDISYRTDPRQTIELQKKQSGGYEAEILIVL